MTKRPDRSGGRADVCAEIDRQFPNRVRPLAGAGARPCSVAWLTAGLAACLTLPLPAFSSEIVVQGTNLLQTVVVPSSLTNTTAISAGRDHVLALQSDGTVAAFGCNGNGQAAPPPGLSNVVAVAAGIYDSLALKNDGTVVAWGFNGEGMTRVPAGLSGVVAVAAGGFHNLALLRNGTVTGWGYNAAGRAVSPAGLTGVVAIAAGRDHSVALKDDGTVVAWGQNDSGQTNVPAGLSDVAAIAAGDAHTLALKADGTVAAWGANDQAQCNIPAGLTNVVQVSGGTGYSLALTADGTVVGWGNNTTGQAQFVRGGLSAISAGGSESVGLTAEDSLQIVQGPSGLVVPTGGSTTLRVTITGAARPTYQWYFEGSPIPGATNETFAVSAAGLESAGNYFVAVSDGFNQVFSQNALVLVSGTPALGLQFNGSGSVVLTIGAQDGLPMTTPDFSGLSLQYSTNLAEWVAVTNQGTIVNGQLRVADDVKDEPIRFYRFVRLP